MIKHVNDFKTGNIIRIINNNVYGNVYKLGEICLHDLTKRYARPLSFIDENNKIIWGETVKIHCKNRAKAHSVHMSEKKYEKT